jgi:hypothetical protein
MLEAILLRDSLTIGIRLETAMFLAELILMAGGALWATAIR